MQPNPQHRRIGSRIARIASWCALGVIAAAVSGTPVAAERPDLLAPDAAEATSTLIFSDVTLPDLETPTSSSNVHLTVPGGIPRFRLRDELAPDPAPDAPLVTPWPAPEDLQERLQRLMTDAAAGNWAARVNQILEELTRADRLADVKATYMLLELQRAAAATESIETKIASASMARELRLASYDLTRRLDVWRIAHKIALDRANANKNADETKFGAARLPGSTGLHILQASATPPVDLPKLLDDLEQFEHTRMVSHARRITAAVDRLKSSSVPAERELAQRLELHYRNANVRVAITGELLNRMLPKQDPLAGDVNENILGVPVHGRSRTNTQLYLRLVPDAYRLRAGLELWGNVHSNTQATSGPVYLHNRGRAKFLVQKLVVVDREGLKTKPSTASAESDTDLVGIESDYDGVPLIGNIVRGMAERRHDEQRSRALRITERRIANQAKERFDEEINPRVVEFVSSFQKEIWQPMVDMGLEPTPIQLQTTEQRVVSRMRLAADDQLSAFTARPRALADSLISVQAHESVLNNALDQLGFAGQTMTLPEVRQRINEQFGAKIEQDDEDLPKKVEVTFADYDPIRVRCENGKLQLKLSLAKLSKGKRTNWCNLVVYAEYEPLIAGLNAELVRNEAIRLDGDRLRLGDQIALRGIFSKVLSQNNRLRLVPDDFVNDQRLADLAVTQTVIDNGWVGVSIGPARQHPEVREARR